MGGFLLSTFVTSAVSRPVRAEPRSSRRRQGERRASQVIPASDRQKLAHVLSRSNGEPLQSMPQGRRDAVGLRARIGASGRAVATTSALEGGARHSLLGLRAIDHARRESGRRRHVAVSLLRVQALKGMLDVTTRPFSCGA